MANVTMRHRQAEAHPIKAEFPTGIAVAQGDLIFNDGTNGAKPASSLTWDTSLAVTQEAFHDAFLGVSCVTRLSTDAAGAGLVATEGIYEFDCAALGAQLEIGALFGPAKQSGNALENQKVANVATANLAVGYLTQRALAGATKVSLRIFGTKTAQGGPQTMM